MHVRRSVRGSSNSLSPKSMMAIPTHHFMLLEHSGKTALRGSLARLEAM